MIRRFIKLGVVVALLGVGDVSARAYVETNVDTRAQARAPSGTTVDTSLGGFPFVPRLLLASTVSRAAIHLENVDAKVINFSTVDITLRDVELDRAKMFARKARIKKISRGTVEAVLSQEALSTALHAPVTIADGEVHVEVLGQKVPVQPGVDANGSFSLSGAGLARAITLKIPATNYVPCMSDVTVLAGRVRLSCVFHDVPPAFLEAGQIKG